MLQPHVKSSSSASGLRSADGVAAVLRAADRLRRHLGRALEPYGVTLQQYNVLRILRRAGLQGLPTMEIRNRLMESAPGITRIVDRLETKGWVERRASVEDRRRILCRITGAGLELLRSLDGRMDAADDRAFEAVDGGELEVLVELLQAVESRLRP